MVPALALVAAGVYVGLQNSAQRQYAAGETGGAKPQARREAVRSA